MNFTLARKYLAISLSVAVTFLWVLATPAAAGETQSTGGTSNGESQTKAEDIIGGMRKAIEEMLQYLEQLDRERSAAPKFRLSVAKTLADRTINSLLPYFQSLI